MPNATKVKKKRGGAACNPTVPAAARPRAPTCSGSSRKPRGVISAGISVVVGVKAYTLEAAAVG